MMIYKWSNYYTYLFWSHLFFGGPSGPSSWGELKPARIPPLLTKPKAIQCQAQGGLKLDFGAETRPMEDHRGCIQLEHHYPPRPQFTGDAAHFLPFPKAMRPKAPAHPEPKKMQSLTSLSVGPTVEWLIEQPEKCGFHHSHIWITWNAFLYHVIPNRFHIQYRSL